LLAVKKVWGEKLGQKRLGFKIWFGTKQKTGLKLG
jgi:hypothetical protein